MHHKARVTCSVPPLIPILLALLLGYDGRTQSFVSHAPVFDAYFQAPYLQSPAVPMLDEERHGVHAGHRSLTGAFREVRTSYLTGFFATGKHILAGKILFDQEGDFYNRSWIGASYTYRLTLSPQLEMGLGAYAGWTRFAFAPSSANDAANDGGFDGKLSVLFVGTTWSMSFVLDQFTNTELQPLGSVLTLKQNIQWLGRYEFFDRPKGVLEFITWGRVTPQEELRVKGTLKFDYLNTVSVAGTVNELLGVSLFSGVKKRLHQGELSLGFSYFFPTRVTAQQEEPQLFELLGGYLNSPQ